MTDFKKIKYIVSDLDGTLTDGHYNVSDNGVVTKAFYSKDFYALEQAQTNGLACIIHTHAQDMVVERKLMQLPSPCKTNLWISKVEIPNPKDVALEKFIYELTGSWWPLNWDEVAYIGDNDNDLGCIEKAAWTGCPADASPIIKQSVNVVTDAAGGKGSVYEFIMDILKRRRDESK